MSCVKLSWRLTTAFILQNSERLETLRSSAPKGFLICGKLDSRHHPCWANDFAYSHELAHAVGEKMLYMWHGFNQEILPDRGSGW